MPFMDLKDKFALLTANGGADGYATVADNTPFYPGASVWIRSTLVAPKEYVITDLVGTTKIGLRLKTGQTGGQNYTRNSIAEYLLADTASLAMNAQVVAVEWDHIKRPLM